MRHHRDVYLYRFVLTFSELSHHVIDVIGWNMMGRDAIDDALGGAETMTCEAHKESEGTSEGVVREKPSTTDIGKQTDGRLWR